MKYYLRALKNYAVFSGRSTRTEYWMWVLTGIIVAALVSVATVIIGVGSFTISALVGLVFSGSGGAIRFLPQLYALFVFLPGISIVVRRLHDTGKSGWFFWIILIPVVGAIWLFILMCIDSTPSENAYGANPKK